MVIAAGMSEVSLHMEDTTWVQPYSFLKREPAEKTGLPEKKKKKKGEKNQSPTVPVVRGKQTAVK